MIVVGLAIAACGQSSAPRPGEVVVDLASGPVSAFNPDQAFGAVIDGLTRGRVDQVYSAHNIQALKSAGLRSTVYSLRTELAIEAWHWSEEGAWSDAAHRQGYWTGSDNPRRPVLTSWGYALPRRGDSVDQANDDGYSRLDDGDPATFWKSNPYLDPIYAHRPARPQWVVVTFPRDTPVSAARIQWVRPFARRYKVQYWSAVDPHDPQGRWITFPGGQVTRGRGGDVILRLSDAPLHVRYVRILLQQSSKTAPPGSTDRRDALGYAVGEIGLGVVGPEGRFIDAVRHMPKGAEQTNVYVSSTDPWHRAVDRDPEVEQPGFDRVFRNGLTNGLPMMVTVGALYDIPDNAAAAIRFLKARGYPVQEVEIGLEPDGQKVSPEDFAALYGQVASAVRKADHHVTLAGPGLQDAVSDTWLDQGADHSWTRRFIKDRAAHGHGSDLGLFTFEHYPNDVLCGELDRKLLAENAVLAADVARLKADGVPPGIPWMIFEYGISAFSGQGEVEMPGALFNADMISHFLALGGRGGNLLGYGPEQLFEPKDKCAGYGELMLFGQDASGRVSWPTPAFWGASLLARDWAQPGGGRHLLYRAHWRSGRVERSPAAWVVGYPVRRPDGRLAVMLINRDPVRARHIRVEVRRRAGRPPTVLGGPVDVVQYGQDQYVWRPDGAAGHPVRDEPPRRFSLASASLTLPPYSLTVLKTAGVVGAN
jgi:hypothetical protein